MSRVTVPEDPLLKVGSSFEKIDRGALGFARAQCMSVRMTACIILIVHHRTKRLQMPTDRNIWE